MKCVVHKKLDCAAGRGAYRLSGSEDRNEIAFRRRRGFFLFLTYTAQELFQFT